MRFLLTLVILGVFLLVGVARSSAITPGSYNPDPYIEQIYTISNHVNNDNWSQANPWYNQLGQICQQIQFNYPGLSNAAIDCINGTQQVVTASVCDGDCHTAYNIKTYGASVDRGLRLIDRASLVLAQSH